MYARGMYLLGVIGMIVGAILLCISLRLFVVCVLIYVLIALLLWLRIHAAQKRCPRRCDGTPLDRPAYIEYLEKEFPDSSVHRELLFVFDQELEEAMRDGR